MSSDGKIITAAAEAEAFIAETGGLPELTRAAGDLRAALDQTRAEIEQAVFANRFPTSPSDHFQVMLKGRSLNILTHAAISEEGEAGLKRASLRARLNRIDGDLFTVIEELVELRTDLIVSQADSISDESPQD